MRPGRHKQKKLIIMFIHSCCMCRLDLAIKLNFNISRGDCCKAHSQSLYVKFRMENMTAYRHFKVTRPGYFLAVPSYFEALWYPHT